MLQLNFPNLHNFLILQIFFRYFRLTLTRNVFSSMNFFLGELIKLVGYILSFKDWKLLASDIIFERLYMTLGNLIQQFHFMLTE